VEDADESVGELAQRGVVVGAACSLLAVVGPAPGELRSDMNAWAISASISRSLCTNRAATTFFLPEARVIGLVPA